MSTIFIAAENFTIQGLLHALRQYTRFRYSTVEIFGHSSGFLHRKPISQPLLDIKTQYLGRWFKQRECSSYCDEAQTARFFCRYVLNIVSQYQLPLLKGDIVGLSPILDRIPRCDVKVVSQRYDVGSLRHNARVYGKPAPQHAFELALFCSRQPDVDDEYLDPVQRVVEEAVRRQKVTSDAA